MQKTAIIIPYYNEEKRIREELLATLLTVAPTHIYLANDGSTDNTLVILQNIAAKYSHKCFVLDYKKNKGKAYTIYTGANYLLATGEYTHIGYFDADFSTPPTEIIRMLGEQDKYPDKFIIGSRVLLLNSNIERKAYRHFIGRFIVTLLNIKYKLGIYDTQCGAKLFPAEIAQIAFTKPFLTAWLFDIEVFARLKANNLLNSGKEFPLNSWKHIKGSKLTVLNGFKILKELYLLIMYNPQGKNK